MDQIYWVGLLIFVFLVVIGAFSGAIYELKNWRNKYGNH